MIDAITKVPASVKEPPSSFAPGSPERSPLEDRLKQLASERAELTMTIGGEQWLRGGEAVDVVQPHRKDAVLGTLNNAAADDVRDAVDASRGAAPGWQRMSHDDRTLHTHVIACNLVSSVGSTTPFRHSTRNRSRRCPRCRPVEALVHLIRRWRPCCRCAS